VQAEVPVRGSRLDFRLEGERPALVEVKSVSLVIDRIARFPDAPSERAARHARVLAAEARRGQRAVLAFAVVRPDAEALAPNAPADPAFARALRHAMRAGVEVRAWRCEMDPGGARLTGEVPVLADR
jgi:sugar fermentation stimulation protein A